MKRKKVIKIINVILFMLVIIFSLSQVVHAEEIDPTKVVPNNLKVSDGTNTLYKLGNSIVGIIQYVAVGVSIVATLLLAIRYMYSAPDDRAEIKKKLIPFIIGGVLVFGAVQLVKLAENIANSI